MHINRTLQKITVLRIYYTRTQEYSGSVSFIHPQVVDSQCELKLILEYAQNIMSYMITYQHWFQILIRSCGIHIYSALGNIFVIFKSQLFIYF